MVYFHYTKNYVEFITLMKNLDEHKNQTFIVFTGTPNETGESWCSDCVEGTIVCLVVDTNNYIIFNIH